MNELTDAEKQLIGFALACYLEDAERKFKKNPAAMKQVKEIERITYTKIIPGSWSGPKPSDW